jgi:methylglutaconyl-CoA hydratase
MATRYELRGSAAWITLDLPERRNALTAELLAELESHLRAAFNTFRVRSVVLTGAGPVFCAGADLKGEQPGRGRQRHPLGAVLELLWTGPKPVVAAVNGSAFGGGVGLVAAADVAVAVEDAEFAFSEVRRGVAPAIVSVVVVPKIGVSAARRLFLSGERFGATTAERLGLVHGVVSASGLGEAVEVELERLRLGGPAALAEARRLGAGSAGSREEFLRAERISAELFASKEAKEGFAAFAEKRRPEWAEESASPSSPPPAGSPGPRPPGRA